VSRDRSDYICALSHESETNFRMVNQGSANGSSALPKLSMRPVDILNRAKQFADEVTCEGRAFRPGGPFLRESGPETCLAEMNEGEASNLTGSAAARSIGIILPSLATIPDLGFASSADGASLRRC
jgi:hypothetical protein